MALLAVWPVERGATRTLEDGRRISGGEVFEVPDGASLPSGCVTVAQSEAAPVRAVAEPDGGAVEPEPKPEPKRSATPARRRRRRKDD